MDYTFWKDRMTLTIGVDDILNTHGQRHTISDYGDLYEEIIFKPSYEGRTYLVGLKYNFNVGKKNQQKEKGKSNSDEMNRL